MFLLSAFADEIASDPEVQLHVLEQCQIRYVELRSAWRTNILDLTDSQVAELKRLLDVRGFGVSAIGSPIGKVKISDPFEPHLERFRRALDLCRVFHTPNIRIFSYYPAEGAPWPQHREEVLRRLRVKIELAAQAGVRLLHENEHRIYGESPDRVVDLLTSLESQHFRAICDPANYVFCGYDPWAGWQQTKGWTVHFHIKDWVYGESHGRPAGEGQANLERILADAWADGFSGFVTLEPHLLGGGPTGGVTGVELFPRAAAALRTILDRLGAKYA
jgi:3-dehydroshikimate dehydratase